MSTNYQGVAAVSDAIELAEDTGLRVGSLAQQVAQLFHEEELVWDNLDGPTRALLTDFLRRMVHLELGTQNG